MQHVEHIREQKSISPHWQCEQTTDGCETNMNEFVFIGLNGQYNDEIENNRSEWSEKEFSVPGISWNIMQQWLCNLWLPVPPVFGYFCTNWS